jgi:hypothetical protein
VVLINMIETYTNEDNNATIESPSTTDPAQLESFSSGLIRFTMKNQRRDFYSQIALKIMRNT